MITLRVVLDDMRLPGSIGRYSEELARALIETAPAGCGVVGIVSAAHDSEIKAIEKVLPGLESLVRLRMSRRALQTLWVAGGKFEQLVPNGARRLLADTGGLSGMLHSTSLLAPLQASDRLEARGRQSAVTIHSAAAFTNPATMSTAEVAWQRAMIKRAAKHADAIVVPTHSTAEQLSHFVDVGERVRVISAAVSSKLRVPIDADARAAALDLPERYLLTTGSLNLARGLGDLITSMATGAAPDVPLVITGASDAAREAIEQHTASLGLDSSRVRVYGRLTDQELAVALDRATVYVAPTVDDGIGLPLMEALSFGAVSVYSDAPAHLEVAAGAGLAVARDDRRNYPERLAIAIGEALSDGELAARLSVLASDRARAFSWRDSAEKVWQLHADL
ncbi:glycosyltransferase family 4 protein [Ruicaihuangia caeni]|uniref:glycosyltransferase family 4 protein n=1 Tax=Ruicaihuangia caeni TaxID=3042517 RepID=UPI00338F2413